MADRIAEINKIGDLLNPVGVTRFYKETFPTTYVKNTIGIRSQPTSLTSLTGAHYSVSNTYQIVYFGSSLVDCLNKSETISGVFADLIGLKTKIRDTDDYMSLMSFTFTPSFKTDTDGVFAVSAMIVVRSIQSRTRPEYEKMAVINADITKRGGN